jgi:two-component system response regulator HydG
VASGAFLPDLFYRLDVLNLNLPPLRDRRGDIPEIAGKMLTEFGSAAPKAPRGFTQAAMAVLQAYDWPGNVRELRNVVQRLVVCSESQYVSASEIANALGITNHLPRTVEEAGDADPGPAARTLKLSTREAELESILKVLDECGGSRTLAARRLGISRVTLWRKLRTYVSASTR